MAIVQQKYVASRKIPFKLFQDFVGVRGNRVKTAASPAHQLQIQTLQNRIQQRAAKSGGCPEVDRASPGNLTDHVLRPTDFVAQLAQSHEGKVVPMRVTVVFNRVPASNYFPRQVRMRFDCCSDTEKGRMGVCRVQKIQHGRSHLRVGAVVYRDGNLLRIAGRSRQAEHVAAQQRAAWP